MAEVERLKADEASIPEEGVYAPPRPRRVLHSEVVEVQTGRLPRGGGDVRYSTPPRELAGRWVAWSRDGRLLASGRTLGRVRREVRRLGEGGASYELIPATRRRASGQD